MAGIAIGISIKPTLSHAKDKGFAAHAGSYAVIAEEAGVAEDVDR